MLEERIAELNAQTKGDLETQAAGLGIKGRSKMSAEELAGAIASEEVAVANRQEAEARAKRGELEPGTPEEVGRPDLVTVAEERAAARKPHRVIGANPTQED